MGSRFHFEIGEGQSDSPRPVRRPRAESRPYQPAKPSVEAPAPENPVRDFIGQAVVLISSGGSRNKDRARDLHKQATSLARRRGLAVPVRAGLIRVASSLANLIASASAAEEQENRHSLAESLRALEEDAQRPF